MSFLLQHLGYCLGSLAFPSLPWPGCPSTQGRARPPPGSLGSWGPSQPSQPDHSVLAASAPTPGGSPTAGLCTGHALSLERPPSSTQQHRATQAPPDTLSRVSSAPVSLHHSPAPNVAFILHLLAACSSSSTRAGVTSLPQAVRRPLAQSRNSINRDWMVKNKA